MKPTAFPNGVNHLGEPSPPFANSGNFACYYRFLGARNYDVPVDQHIDWDLGCGNG